MAFVSSTLHYENNVLRRRSQQSIHRKMCPQASDSRVAPESRTVSRRAAVSVLAALGAGIALPHASRADHTLVSAKRAFDRYYPRIVDGSDILREVGKCLARGDVADAASLTEDKKFDIKFRRALRIYATSFSDNYVGKQSRQMLSCIDGMYGELQKMKDAPTPEEAAQHYSVAVSAFKAYIKIARLPGTVTEGFEI